MTRRNWLHTLLAAPFLSWLFEATTQNNWVSTKTLECFRGNLEEAYPHDDFSEFKKYPKIGDTVTIKKPEFWTRDGFTLKPITFPVPVSVERIFEEDFIKQ